MEWNTRVTRLLGIKYPIIEGALANFGNADIAVAVSEAGGLGMITARTMGTPQKLRNEIRRARSLTDKPFAVNLSPSMDPALDEMREVAISERVPVIETAGYKAAEHGKRAKDAGIIWIHKVHTVKHAVAAEKDGADAVCIMGVEGAGLKNATMLTTLVSVALAAKRVKISLIAAGGIGDARTFLGALALGADAVMLGSVFCAVKECPLHERFKQALIDADPYDPKWRDPILATPKAEDMERLRSAKDSKSVMRAAGAAERTGIPRESGLTTISLAIAFMDRIMTSKELIDGMITEAERILTTEGIGGFKLAAR